MSEQQRHGEPSVEEIMSSIRRIVIEGEPGDRGNAGEADPRTDVLVLTDIVEEPPTASTPSTTAGSAGPVPQREEKPAERIAAERTAAEPERWPEELVSASAAAAATATLARLARAAAPEARTAIPAASPPRSLEETVLELLKPMLQDWLDQHLPELVERIVEQEVKKLARRAENS